MKEGKHGGGGTGGCYFGEDGGNAYMYGGTKGTSYSGGTGSGGLNSNSSGTVYNIAGSINGGIGGIGKAYRDSARWVDRNSGGGTGNPGGNGASHETGKTLNEGNSVELKGNDGTGGLLVIYCNTFNNRGLCCANGVDSSSKKTTVTEPSGGASGGGSINIFYQTVTNYGKLEANGGKSVNYGGAGGNGSITIGSIETGTFVTKKVSFISEISKQTTNGIQEINVYNEDYSIDMIIHTGDMVLDGTTQIEGATLTDKVYEFGNKETDVATETEDAKNTVVLKVEGNLTINEGVTVTACKSENGYGGPKGLFIYCTGTLTNNGTISMTARGAKAEGQNVYLWQNENGSYEYVPAERSKWR